MLQIGAAHLDIRNLLHRCVDWLSHSRSFLKERLLRVSIDLNMLWSASTTSFSTSGIWILLKCMINFSAIALIRYLIKLFSGTHLWTNFHSSAVPIDTSWSRKMMSTILLIEYRVVQPIFGSLPGICLMGNGVKEFRMRCEVRCRRTANLLSRGIKCCILLIISKGRLT